VAVVRIAWRQLVALQVVLAVVTFGLQGAAGVVAALALRDADLTANGTEQPPLGDLLAAGGLTVVAVLISVLLSTLATLVAVHIVVQAATAGQPRLASCLAGASRRLLPMIGWGLLAGLIVIGGVCACILPAFYFGAVFTILAPVVAVERGGAIGRCFKLFNRDVGASLARVATIGAIWVGGGLLAAVPAALGGAITDPASATTPALVISELVGTAVTVAISGVLRVLIDPLTVAAYADMRARVEPLSSSVIAQELAR
jgi:hypothetical protein